MAAFEPPARAGSCSPMRAGRAPSYLEIFYCLRNGGGIRARKGCLIGLICLRFDSGSG